MPPPLRPALPPLLSNAIVLVALSFSANANATTFTVTSLADSGPGTLRAAITQSNAAGGANTIDLSGLNGIIGLQSELPDTMGEVTLLGPSAAAAAQVRIERVATAYFRLLTVDAGAKVTVSGLVLRNGVDSTDAGGVGTGASAIQVNSSGTLVVSGCGFTDNGLQGSSGGVIGGQSGSSITVEGSTIQLNYASGIVTAGTLTVTGSVISQNGSAPDYSSGIYLESNETVAVSDTTISGNVGAGIVVVGAALTLARCTVSGNSNGGLSSSGEVSVVNSTFSGNTGGIADITLIKPTTQAYGPTIDLLNCTLVQGAAARPELYLGVTGGTAPVASLRNTVLTGAGSLCSVMAGATLTSLGHNLASDTTCALTAAGDRPSTDPILGPLADNGGPTQTHALLAGSPAIDSGDNAGVPATDQRGFARIVGPSVDIGAYEYAPSTADAGADASDGGYGEGGGSDGAPGDDAEPDEGGEDAAPVEGGASPDAAVAAVDATAPSGADAASSGAGDASAASGSSGGCGCTVIGTEDAQLAPLVAGLALAALGVARAQRRRRGK